jgi:bifunctional DNase/RNase
MKTPYRLLVVLLYLSSNIQVHAAEPATLESRVKTLVIDPTTQTPVVVLETVADNRLLPIWIDVPEARAIALELENVTMPRPLTHDLIRSILQSVGATLQRITITELRNNTYYAQLTLAVKDKVVQVDSRPSDAIAVAVRMKAPIFVSTQVLERSKAVPVPAARLEQIHKKLGLQVQDLTPELAKLFDTQQQRGVLVTDVSAGAASKAGIQRGDIIAKANDQSIGSASDLEAGLQNAKPASQLRLEVIKKGKPITIVIDLPS